MADCEPLVGGSMAWLSGGLVAMAVGLGLLVTLTFYADPCNLVMGLLL